MKFTSSTVHRTMGMRKKMSSLMTWIVFAAFFIFIGISIIFLNSGYMENTKTEAVICEIQTVSDYDSNHAVIVEFKVNGQTVKARLNTYASSYSVGDKIKIAYDKGKLSSYSADNNDDLVYADNTLMGMIFIAAGVLSVVIAVYNVIKQKSRDAKLNQSVNELDAGNASENFTAEFPADVSISAEDVSEYYFRFCGKLGQSYRLETVESRSAVYEIQLRRFALIGNSKYDFVDHTRKCLASHKVGNTVTTNEHRYNSVSGFKFDNEDIWDFLHRNGVTIDSDIQGIMHNAVYTVNYLGSPVGEITSRGTEILEENRQPAAVSQVPVQGLYSVKCSEANIPIVCLVTFALARTDVTVYD